MNGPQTTAGMFFLPSPPWANDAKGDRDEPPAIWRVEASRGRFMPRRLIGPMRETSGMSARGAELFRPQAVNRRPRQRRSMPIRVPVIRGAIIIVQFALSAAIGPIVGSIPRKSWRTAQLLLRYIGTISA